MWNKGGQESVRQWSLSEIGISCACSRTVINYSSGSASLKVTVPTGSGSGSGSGSTTLAMINPLSPSATYKRKKCIVLYWFEICHLTQNSVWFPAQDSERNLCVDSWNEISIFFLVLSRQLQRSRRPLLVSERHWRVFREHGLLHQNRLQIQFFWGQYPRSCFFDWDFFAYFTLKSEKSLACSYFLFCMLFYLTSMYKGGAHCCGSGSDRIQNLKKDRIRGKSCRIRIWAAPDPKWI